MQTGIKREDILRMKVSVRQRRAELVQVKTGTMLNMLAEHFDYRFQSSQTLVPVAQRGKH
jgi:hypothetical protein